jgi:hypothetical protein
VVPSHAVELTSASLDRAVSKLLARRKLTTATREQKQKLAALIHLCGAAAGDAYARRGFRLRPGQRCGDHDVRAYLTRATNLSRLFAELAGQS